MFTVWGVDYWIFLGIHLKVEMVRLPLENKFLGPQKSEKVRNLFFKWVKWVLKKS
jgi:hypothetical protein